MLKDDGAAGFDHIAVSTPLASVPCSWFELSEGNADGNAVPQRRQHPRNASQAVRSSVPAWSALRAPRDWGKAVAP